MTTLLEHAHEISDIHSHQDAVIRRDVESMVGHLNGDPHFPSLVHQTLPIIINQHAHAAGLYTADWYNGIDPGSRFKARPIVDIPPEQIAKVIDWALYAPGEEPLQSRLVSNSQRLVRDASHLTVVGNAAKEGARWARYAKPSACAFCRALSMRGSGAQDQKYLYHTEESAIHRKSDGEKYHTHCECEPVPVRGEQVWTPPDYTSEWDKQYAAARKQTPGGKDFFKRIVAQMRANEPPPAQPEAPSTPTPDEAHQAARQTLESATDFTQITQAAAKLLPDTDIPNIDETLLRQADYGSPSLWEAKAPAVQENIKGAIRAADDVMTKYPGLRLDTFDPSTDQTVFASPNIFAHASHSWDKGTFTVQANRSYTANPAALQDLWDKGVETGFHYPGGENAMYAVTMHEMGHVIQQNAEARGIFITNDDISQALADYFYSSGAAPQGLATRGGALSIQAYDNWLADNLSGYSTYSTIPLEVGGKLREHAPNVTVPNPINGREALAEAFADVEINGDDAHETSKVLHSMLIDAHHQGMAQDHGLATAV